MHFLDHDNIQNDMPYELGRGLDMFHCLFSWTRGLLHTFLSLFLSIRHARFTFRRTEASQIWAQPRWMECLAASSAQFCTFYIVKTAPFPWHLKPNEKFLIFRADTITRWRSPHVHSENILTKKPERLLPITHRPNPIKTWILWGRGKKIKTELK